MQVAIIIESALAVSIIATSSAIASGLLYASSTGSRNPLGQGDATYDLFAALLRNGTYAACLANNDTSCMERFLGMFAIAYGLRYISLSFRGGTFAQGNASTCGYRSLFCLPLEYNSSFSVACLSLCD